MAKSQLVWFTANSDKYFPTEAKALEYEKQQELLAVIVATGLNEEAGKKAAKAILAAYTITPKAILAAYTITPKV
jgi:NAD(P)H-hydrate repair Nnr-like enzyme with NAD(P)H-hydrate epimerase domain